MSGTIFRARDAWSGWAASVQVPTEASSSATVSDEISAKFCPASLTIRASGRSRLPPHDGQGAAGKFPRLVLADAPSKVPSPRHFGQAPSGELKLNKVGSGSENSLPQF